MSKNISLQHLDQVLPSYYSVFPINYTVNIFIDNYEYLKDATYRMIQNGL